MRDLNQQMHERATYRAKEMLRLIVRESKVISSKTTVWAMGLVPWGKGCFSKISGKAGVGEFPKVRKNKYVSETTVIIQNIAMTSLSVFPFSFYFIFNVFLFSLAKCGLRKLKAHRLKGNIKYDLEIALPF